VLPILERLQNVYAYKNVNAYKCRGLISRILVEVTEPEGDARGALTLIVEIDWIVNPNCSFPIRPPHRPDGG
jgi:hypothetical protein